MYGKDIVEVNRLADPLLTQVNYSIRHHERRLKQLEKLRDVLIQIAHNDPPIGLQPEERHNGLPGDVMEAIRNIDRADLTTAYDQIPQGEN